MNLSLGTNCSQITVNSEYFAPSNLSVRLKVTYNCSDLCHTYDLPGNTTSIVVDPVDLGMVASLKDGIYSLELEIVDPGGTLIKDSLCYFVNCSSACNIATITEDIKKENFVKLAAYIALNQSKECPICTCKDMCELFNISQLNNCNLNAGCGCK